MAGNKITRDDLVEGKVFDIGPDYAKAIEQAVEANFKWLNSFKSLKEVALEMSALEKQIKGVTNNTEFIKAKEREVEITTKANAGMKEQARLAKANETAKAKFYSTQSGINKELQKTRFETNELNKKVREQAQLSSKLASEYKKQEIRLKQLRDAYKELAIRKETSGKLSKKETAEMKKLGAEASKLDRALKKVDKAVGQSQRNVGNYSSALKGLGSSFKSLIGAFGLASGIFLFARAVRDAFKRVKDFDASMQNLAGVMRTTRGDINDLEKTIIAVAGESVRTSNEVAKLAESLATLGKTKEEIQGLLKPVIDLSIALETPADAAGEFLVQMLNTFGKSTESAAEFADTIATIRTSTTLDFEKMRTSFAYVAPISAALNKDLAYTGALVGILADNGIKAQSAGRLLGTSMIRLATQGLSLEDALLDINKAMASGKNEYEVLAVANKLFGTQASKLGVILAKNTENLEINAQAIRDNGGALEDLVEQQMQSVENKLLLLDSAYETFILSIENGNGKLSKGFVFILESLTGLLVGFTELNKTFDEKKLDKYNLRLKLQTEQYKELGDEAEIYAEIDKRLSEQKLENLNKDLEKQKEIIERNKKFKGFWYGFLFGGADGENALRDAEGYVKSLTDEIARQEGVLAAANTQLEIYSDRLEDVVGIGLESKDQSKTIGDLQNDLAQLQKDRLKLNETDIEGIKIKTKEIEVLRNKINALLGVSKATRAAAKVQKDYNFESNKFINDTKIKFLEDFAKNERNDFETRQVALKVQADLEVDLLEYVNTEKLKKVKKGTDEERYLLIQWEKEKQDIIKRFEQSTDDLALDKIKADGDKEINIQKKILNELLLIENERFNSTKDQYKDLEAATIAHEKRVLDIKKKFAVDALNAQISTIESLLKAEKFSASERIKYEAEVAKKKVEISDLLKDVYKKGGEERVMTEKEISDAIKDISMELAYTIGDILNNVSNARIAQYQKEIELSNEKFDKLLDNENLYEEDRKRIEEMRENSQKEIERKIAKEKRRQAILDKALGAVQVGINTAVNISKVIPNPILIALVAALGAAQLAAIATTPIPQYEKGTDNHKGGFALVGEKRPEVIHEPNKAPYVVSSPTILDLPKGTKVTPSLEEYQKLMRASILASVESSNDKMNAFQTGQIFDSRLVDKLDEVKKSISNIKQNVTFRGVKAPDINFQLWRFQQTNWRS